MSQEQRHEHATPHPSTSGSRGRVVSEVANKVLQTLDAVANYCPVPGIAQAASLALRISDTVQKAKVNQAAFFSLADDAAQLIYVIFCTYKDSIDTTEGGLDNKVKTNIDDVLKVLLEIQEFVNHSTSRGKIAGFLLSAADEGKITECRERLQHCLTKFGFESALTVQLMVIKLAAQNEKMLDMLQQRRSESGNINGGDTIQGHGVPNSIQTGHHDVQKSGAAPLPSETTITFGTGTNFSGASGVTIGSHNHVNNQS